MNKLKSILIVLIIYISASQFINSQNGGANFCDISEPLCASNEFSYPNTSGAGNAENGPNYGCLLSEPNPAWFYLLIEQSGDVFLQIGQSSVLGGDSDLDVDFIAWGPFTAAEFQAGVCSSLMPGRQVPGSAVEGAPPNTTTSQGCSYTTSDVENFNIIGANAGEYYILLITNFDDLPGFVTVNQISGTGTTDCRILADEFACEGETVTLDATTNFATNYVWYVDDGLGNGNFTVINGVSTATYDVATSNKYKAEAYDVLNNLLETFEYNVLFFQTPVVLPDIQDYVICDNLDENDGIGQFDFSTKDNEILNGLDPNSFSVSYYATIADANAETNQLSSLYINSLPSEVIFARIDNIVSNEVECYDVGSFNILVNLLPEFNLEDEYILCVDTNGTEEIPIYPIIDTGLDIVNYSFEWSLDGNILLFETESNIIAIQGGNYTVEVTNIITGCSNSISTIVTVSSPPTLDASIISYAFIEDNVIQVTATGTGEQEYEYSLDYGLWQESDTFSNVSAGEHIVMARDINGCGINLTTIIVIDYPLYFTPNGDGFHDTWNIIAIDTQPNAKIFIYDRYGKLLKQLRPIGKGWDGTFNGFPLPTNDYWFTVEFIEPKDGTLKIFKSHFTLKR
ncbi:MAG: T9SS type B sorting domain-containing protein [Bacteroidetes bacterium]|nr:T9SS type B sorting domain-containing protein [Bacteroidota bacterium]